jgi:hypothetical protein
MRWIIVLGLLTLAACGGGGEDLPTPKGKWFQLNQGYWNPTAAELKPPKGT